MSRKGRKAAPAARLPASPSHALKRMLDQRMCGIGAVHGIGEHVHARLAGMRAAILADDFRNTQQHLAGDRQGLGWDQLGVDGGIEGVEQFEAGWIGD